MTRIIALFNQAGGVGKTTLTMNVGYHLVERGHQVLLVDMDPQGSLTTFMGVKRRELKKTICDAIVKEEPLPIHQNIHNMDLVPANTNLSGAEKMLANEIMPQMRLKTALETIQENYDFILIDCPPQLGFPSIISLIAATHVLIPIQTHYKALEGTADLSDTIRRVLKSGNRLLKIAGAVPTIYDARTNQDSDSLKRIEKTFEKSTVYAAIPRRVDFVNASQAHVPLAVYVPKDPAVKPLMQIAESLERL